VARVARLLGFQARIWVPANTAAARIAAIESEGADVEITDGSYNDAVREAARAARFASGRTILVSDTSSDACTRAPRWVIEGYSTMFLEIDQQLTELRLPSPDIVVVPVGVGALAASAVIHFRRRRASRRTLVIGAEPTTAACVGASLAAGHPLELPGTQDSIMAGLNCASPSLVAWPFVSAGLDFLATIDDDQARQAMRDLAAHGVVAGESGAASLAGLREALAYVREDGAIHGATSALLISTEGATDPEAYTTVVGCSADEVATAA
jgi:diaminopropionate ammonia-lyase